MATNSIKINNITLDVDPESYTIIGGRRRGSIHPLIDGRTIFQDRGFNASDQRITISGKLINLTTLKALYSLYRATPGTTMSYEDFKGNAFTVIFTPGMEAFVVNPIPGSSRGYTYTMNLSVTAVTKHLGDAV